MYGITSLAKSRAIDIRDPGPRENGDVRLQEIAGASACSAGSDITASPTQLVARTRIRRNSPSIMGTVVTHNGCLLYTRRIGSSAAAIGESAGKTVVFTNGCYDILHPGHIRLLEQARSLGDILILALNTDSSVQRLKGPSRPLIPRGRSRRTGVRAGGGRCGDAFR